MKLRYIIPMFIAVVAMLASCTDDDKKSYLSQVQVSQSYIPLPAGDETDAADKMFQAEITINAAGDWQFKNVPEWLTITPPNGGAGKQTIVFQAAKTTETRTAFLKLLCNGQEQEINVIQQAKKVEVPISTCAEICAGTEGKTYRAKGTVKSIANTTYGNWYLADETGEVYVYGTLDAKGAEKNFLSLGINVGDIVTVEGPMKNYNGTIELVNVSVLAIEKSLLKIDSLDIKDNTISKQGGEFHVVLENKGDGLNIIVPDDAKEWLFVTGINISGTTSVVTLRALPNTGAARTATVSFVTTSGGKQYTSEAKITQEADVLPHGENPEDPFTVAEAVAKCKAIGNTSDGVIYYAKGIISSISSIDTGSYGNATFNISDDGTETNAITCFRSLFLNNEKFTAEDQIAVGDEVIITGKLVNYKDKNGNETPEFSGNVYIYKHTKASNDPGSKAKPFTPAEANAFCQTLGEGNTSTDDMYIKGKIVSYANNGEFGTQYGNASFYISVDGQESSEQFYVFRTLYLGNVKYTDDTWAKPVVGDEVVICGKLMLYKDKNGNLIPETSGNKSYIYSLNGKTN